MDCKTVIIAFLLFLITISNGFAQKNQVQNKQVLDSLNREVAKVVSAERRANLLYEIGIATGINRITYWDSLLTKVGPTNLLIQSRILDKMGLIYSNEGDIYKAIDAQKRALLLAEKVNKKEDLLVIISHLIRDYFVVLDRKNALTNIYRGLKTAEEINDYKAVLDFYSNVALFYLSSGEPSKALKLYFKCLNECKKLSYYYGIAGALVDIGTAYIALNRNDKAAIYYMKSLDYADELKESSFALYHIYTSVSCAYSFMKRIDSAYFYAKRAYEIAIQTNDKKALIIALHSLSSVSRDKGNLKEAERLENMSLKLSKEANFIAQLPLIYEQLEDIYVKKGDYKKALDAYKKRIHIRDSLSNEQVRKQAVEREFTYNYLKKKQENDVLLQQNQVQALQLKNNRNLLFAFGILLLALFVIVYLYVKQSKYRTEHTKITMEQKLLLSQMNPHFIFNSLNSIKQFVMKGQNDQAETYLSKFAKLIRELLEASTRENISVEEEMDILQAYLEMESLRFSESFTYQLSVDNTIDASHTFIPHLMIQPFVENAIWHGLLPKEKDRHLTIVISKHTDHSIKCVIDDNGVGRTIDRNPANKKSLALDLIKKRIEIMSKAHQIKGSLVFLDKTDNNGNSMGTTITLVLPILKGNIC